MSLLVENDFNGGRQLFDRGSHSPSYQYQVLGVKSVDVVSRSAWGVCHTATWPRRTVAVVAVGA